MATRLTDDQRAMYAEFAVKGWTPPAFRFELVSNPRRARIGVDETRAKGE